MARKSLKAYLSLFKVSLAALNSWIKYGSHVSRSTAVVMKSILVVFRCSLAPPAGLSQARAVRFPSSWHGLVSPLPDWWFDSFEVFPLSRDFDCCFTYFVPAASCDKLGTSLLNLQASLTFRSVMGGFVAELVPVVCLMAVLSAMGTACVFNWLDVCAQLCSNVCTRTKSWM